jgi:hypothetical protein
MTPKHDKPEPPLVQTLSDMWLLSKLNGQDGSLQSFIGLKLTMKLNKEI